MHKLISNRPLLSFPRKWESSINFLWFPDLATRSAWQVGNDNFSYLKLLYLDKKT